MQITLTESQLFGAIFGFWLCTALMVMFLPSMSQSFKNEYAGWKYALFAMLYCFWIPAALTLTLHFKECAPVSSTKPAFTITIGGEGEK